MKITSFNIFNTNLYIYIIYLILYNIFSLTQEMIEVCNLQAFRRYRYIYIQPRAYFITRSSSFVGQASEYTYSSARLIEFDLPGQSSSIYQLTRHRDYLQIYLSSFLPSFSSFSFSNKSFFPLSVIHKNKNRISFFFRPSNLENFEIQKKVRFL